MEQRDRWRRLDARSVLLLAAWIGLAAGLAEGLFITAKAFWLRELVPDLFRPTQHALWMTPTVSASVFVGFGLILLAAWRIGGERPPVETAAAMLAVPAAATLLMATGRVELWAAILFALGVAVQARRLIAPRPARFRRYLRHSTPRLAAVVLAFAVAVPLAEAWGERRGLAGLGPAPEGAPNVLLIVLDTERAENLGLHGHQRPTSPELDELAGSSVVFDRAISTSPFTLTSHATLFTGRWSNVLGVDWQTPLDRHTPTLAERLAEAGYVTGAFVGNTAYANDQFRLDRGFTRYEDNPVSVGQAILVHWMARNVVRWVRRRGGNHRELARKTASDVRRDFSEWLEQTPDRPFFAFLNFFDAHDPYRPPDPWNSRFTADGARYWSQERPKSASIYTRRELEDLERSYDNEIAYLDHELGALFDELARRGILDETLVVITSDHGEQFGEHGLVRHGNSLYMHLLHVPLVIRPPGGVDSGGSRIRTPVSTRALGATILDAAGIGDADQFPGRSLRGHWTGGGVPPDTVLAERAGDRSVLAGRYHLITTGPDSVVLYDLRADPDELEDLSDSDGHRSRLIALTRYLDRSPLALGEPVTSDSSPPDSSDG